MHLPVSICKAPDDKNVVAPLPRTTHDTITDTGAYLPGCHQRRSALKLFETPLHDGLDDGAECFALVGQSIRFAARLLGGRKFFRQAVIDQSRESIGQDVRRDTFGRRGKFTKVRSTQQEVSHDQERPLVADDVERACHRAAGSRMFHCGRSFPGCKLKFAEMRRACGDSRSLFRRALASARRRAGDV